MAANIPPSNDFVGISSPGKVSGSSFSLAFGFLKGKLGGTIENLLSEGRGEVVAKPQITTLDNTEAKIFIGQKLPYNKLDDQYNATTEFVEAGIQLIVTPHITNDNKIILDLAPQRSAANIDPVTRGPIVTTTEAKTTVVVNDGQTVVIGGLTSKTENEIEKGIPFLKDIPLLGIFFKYKKKEVVKNDLIIFITPYIVKNQTAVLHGRPGNKVNSQQNRFIPVKPSPVEEEGSAELEAENLESDSDDLSSDYQKKIMKDKGSRTFSPETGEDEESKLDFPFFE
jgi:type IV pilus assembly protein PilQ